MNIFDSQKEVCVRGNHTHMNDIPPTEVDEALLYGQQPAGQK